MFKIFENSSTTIDAGDYIKKKSDMAVFNGAERIRKCQNNEEKIFKGHEDYGKVRRGYIECLAGKVSLFNNHQNELFDKDLKKTDLFDYFISNYKNDTGININTSLFPYDINDTSNLAYDKYIKMMDFDKSSPQFRFKLIETMCRNHRYMKIFSQSNENRIDRNLEEIPELSIFEDNLEDNIFESLMFYDDLLEDNKTDKDNSNNNEVYNIANELTAMSYQYEYDQLLNDDVDDTALLLGYLQMFTSL